MHQRVELGRRALDLVQALVVLLIHLQIITVIENSKCLKKSE
jgi:hypothetical protein